MRFYGCFTRGIIAPSSVTIRRLDRQSSFETELMAMQTPDSDAKIELNQVVQKYLGAAGSYGRPVELASLGLSVKEVEDVFSTFDEDYQISRYFHFECASGANYQINGFPQTHVSIDAEIQSIL
jgi:hypothetical protein